jgi:hypothetical protein
VEHRIELGHKPDFNETTILVRSASYTDRLMKEAIKIRFHPNSFNRDSGLMLGQAWHLLTKILRRGKQRSDERVQRDARLSDTELGQIGTGTTMAADGPL